MELGRDMSSGVELGGWGFLLVIVSRQDWDWGVGGRESVDVLPILSHPFSCKSSCRDERNRGGSWRRSGDRRLFGAGRGSGMSEGWLTSLCTSGWLASSSDCIAVLLPSWDWVWTGDLGKGRWCGGGWVPKSPGLWSWKALSLTVVREEVEGVGPPTDRGFVGLEPVDPKDDRVGTEAGDVQQDELLVRGRCVCDGELDVGRMVGDCAGGDGASVNHQEIERDVLLLERDLMLINKGQIGRASCRERV